MDSLSDADLSFSVVFDDALAPALVDPVSYEIIRNPVRATRAGEIFDAGALARYNMENDNAAGMSPVSGVELGAIVAADDVAKQLAELRLRLRGNLPAAASPGAAGTPGQAAAARARSMEDVAGIFRCLDKMRPVLGDMLGGWEPPRIVVVGSTSVGKSTLLERLAMMPLFPRDRTLCTRAPIHLRLRRCAPKDSHARIAVLNTKTREEQPPGGRMIAIDSGWRQVSERMAEMLADADERAVSGSHAIVLTVHHSCAPLIDLVDLPGVQSDSAASRELTEGIVRAHVGKRTDDMYLLVAKWATNCRTNDAGGLLFLGDGATKARTVGVLTHCDKVRDAEDREWLGSILQREPGEQLAGSHGIARLEPNGWVAVASAERAPVAATPGRLQPTAGLQRLLGLRRSELEHFRSHEELRELVDEGSATCDALVQRLEGMYLRVLEDEWLPKTLRRISEHARELERELTRLGSPAQPTDEEARAEVDLLLEQGYGELMKACWREVFDVVTPIKANARHFGHPFPRQTNASELRVECGILEWQLRMLADAMLDDLLSVCTHRLRTLLLSSPAERPTPFRIERFKAYAAHILDALQPVVSAAVGRARVACAAVLTSTFDLMSSRLFNAEFDVGSERVTLRGSQAASIDAILTACALHLPSLAELRSALTTVAALGGEREACSAERARLEEQRALAHATGAELCAGVCRAALQPLCVSLGASGAQLMRRRGISIWLPLPRYYMERVQPGLLLVLKFGALEKLHLTCGSIGDPEAAAIAAALRGNSSLTALNLSSNKIGDQGAAAIVDMLRHNFKENTDFVLKTLDLKANPIGDSCKNNLREIVRVNSSKLPLELLLD